MHAPTVPRLPATGLLLLLGACTPDGPDGAADGETDAHDPDARTWVPIPAMPAADVATDRLCQVPDESAPGFSPDPDAIQIACRVETMSYAPTDLPAPDGPLWAMTFNIERGLQLDGILDAFDAGDLPLPDLLLLSEVDRGCSRTGTEDVTRRLAEHLGMDAVFGVEFVELPRTDGSGGSIGAACEHGNAVLSRYPLGNAQWGIHDANLSWYQPPEDRTSGEPRLGGRSWVAADARVGDQLVRLVSLHFESRSESWSTIHPAQAAEAAEVGSAPGGPAIVAGDTNFPAYSFDLARDDGTVNDPGAAAILDRGYVDAHDPLPVSERATRSGLVIDLLFGRGVTFSDPAVCAASLCSGLSDHQAVWSRVSLLPSEDTPPAP